MREAKFGQYRLVAELGQGGMADVILALSQGMVGFSKLVVIKRLRSHLADDPEFVGMMIDEARLAARLNHPNVVVTNDMGEVDGQFFIAMEYLDGQPLSRIRRRFARLGDQRWSFPVQARVIAEVLAGLDYAHNLTDFDGTPLMVVHRDVTPSNVFITYDGVVKLVDFGIARAIGRTTETRTGVVKGKMRYMAPEQAAGAVVDHRADVYAAGVMLWEAATGTSMWEGMDDIAVLTSLIRGESQPAPRLIRPELPEAIDRICERALAPKREERYGSALEFQNDLEDLLASMQGVPSNRAIGRLVAEVFEEERQKVRTIIEEQLSKMATGTPSMLKPVTIPMSVSSSNIVVPPSVKTAIAAQIARVPAREDDPVSTGTGSAAVTTSDVIASEPPPPRPRPAWSLALVAFASAALLLAVFSWYNATQRRVVPPSSPPGVQAAPSAAPEAQPKRVIVRLRASPPDAQFSVDGGPWLENPYLAEKSYDSGIHEIRIRAAGHQSKTIRTRLDQDLSVDVTLVPVESADDGGESG